MNFVPVGFPRLCQKMQSYVDGLGCRRLIDFIIGKEQMC